MRDETKSAEAAARAGFLGWVTTLVHGHRARLLAIARRQGLAPEDALDCVQEAFSTFLQLPEAGALAGRSEDAGRVLATRVQHAAQNHRRKLERREPVGALEELELAADLPSAEVLVERAEARAELVRCVERLSRMQQAVVRLRLLDEHPGEEVSVLLGVSTENVRVLLFRARQRLRECLVLAGDVEGSVG